MKIFLPICLLLGLIACESVSQPELISDTLVVSGYLYAGNSVDSLRVTQANSYSGNDSSLLTMDELSITISDSSNSWLLESIGDGYYRQTDLIIQEGLRYELSFENNEKIIRSETYIPYAKPVQLSVEDLYLAQITGGPGGGMGGGSMPEPLEVSWENDGDEYFFVLVENLEEEPEYINLFLAEQLAVEGAGLNRFRAITEPEITDLYTIDTRRSIQQYGTYRVIVYRVNAEYAALYGSSQTSSLSLATPPSNIEGGLGIFTGASGDTAYFEVRQL